MPLKHGIRHQSVTLTSDFMYETVQVTTTKPLQKETQMNFQNNCQYKVLQDLSITSLSTTTSSYQIPP